MGWDTTSLHVAGHGSGAQLGAPNNRVSVSVAKLYPQNGKMFQEKSFYMPDKSISYNKLWKLLIDKNMNNGDLTRISGISTTSIAKMSKGQNVQLDVLLKVCNAFDCKVEDIIETVDARTAKEVRRRL